MLREYEAGATFFCIGQKVRKAPQLFERIRKEGHAVGNHTEHHLNGKRHPDATYLRNVETCAEVVPSDLFRPPYGRMRRSQIRALQKSYRIIMWDVLSKDFDVRISGEQCVSNVIRNTQKGSVIVFHDSEKAAERVLYALPRVLSHYSKQGFRFRSLGKGPMKTE